MFIGSALVVVASLWPPLFPIYSINVRSVSAKWNVTVFASSLSLIWVAVFKGNTTAPISAAHSYVTSALPHHFRALWPMRQQGDIPNQAETLLDSKSCLAHPRWTAATALFVLDSTNLGEGN